MPVPEEKKNDNQERPEIQLALTVLRKAIEKEELSKEDIDTLIKFLSESRMGLHCLFKFFAGKTGRTTEQVRASIISAH